MLHNPLQRFVLIYMSFNYFFSDIYADIIFGHPESFLKCKSVVSFLHEIDDKVGAIIVDECHKIDDW